MSDVQVSVYALVKSGGCELQIKLNMIKPSLLEYCEIYEEFLRWRGKGFNWTQSVEHTAEKLCLTESKVKMAISQVV